MTSIEQPEAQLRIGELARCAGVTSRAIRHYHATGLLPEPRRDASGHRRYGPGDLVRLVHVCRLRALGMPIDQVARALEETTEAGGDLPSALLAHAFAGKRASGETFQQLLARFRTVTQDEAESLAQEFALVVPAPRNASQAADLPTMDRLLGDRLNPAQRRCLVRLRSLLQDRATPSQQPEVRANARG